jgi:hypothetical protein
MPEMNKVNEELEEENNSRSVYVQISPIHRLGHNGNEWVLWTAPKNPKDPNKIKYSPCYPSTLRYALKLVTKDELFEAFSNFDVMEELSYKFDELFNKTYSERKAAIDTWFDSIVLNSDVEKKYDNKCKELIKLRNEFKQFKIDHGHEGEE